MKKLLLAILLLASLNSFAQYNPYKHERGENIDTWMAIGVITTSVVLGGIGDGFNDGIIGGESNKVLGHSLNAISTGILVASPFLLNIPKEKW